MPRVDPSQTSNVRQLCEWFESRRERLRPSSYPGEKPIRMDESGARAGPEPVEDIRAKFLHNLRMFEQRQAGTLARQSGLALHGSSPALHETVTAPLPSCPTQTRLTVGASRTAECCSGDVWRRASSPEGSPLRGHGSETTCHSYRHSCEMASSVSSTDCSRNVSPVSENLSAVSGSPESLVPSRQLSGNCSRCAQHSHQPVIRERVKDEGERGGCSRHNRKNPLLRMLSSQSGLGNRVQVAGEKKSANNAGASTPQKPSCIHEPDRARTRSQLCFQPNSSSCRRQSVTDLQPHHGRRGHRLSCDLTADSSASAHRFRMVSTATIQLRKQSLPVSRKRSSSEERKISVIQTSKHFPGTMTKPCPMLDEWLSSLVKQARVQPQEEDIECDEESLPVRQQLYGSRVFLENSWQYPAKCNSYQPSGHCGKDSFRNRTSEPRDGSSAPSDVCEFSVGTSYLDQSNTTSAVPGEHLHRRRTSKDNIQHRKCERRSSEEKVSPQSSVAGPGVPVRVTEEDEDSACVQSVSDSASVQLCVPISEDPTSTSPRQHLPLSPCSSLGSYHSAMSSNSDSAVDMALPDDETMEMEASHEGSTDSALKLKQALFARSQCSSSSAASSSSCKTMVTSINVVSPVKIDPLPISVSPRLELPSFLISDHSSAECTGDPQDSEMTQREDSVEPSHVLEPSGYLCRSPSAASSSSEGSYCSTCWTDSSVSDNELPARRPEKKRKQSSWKKIRSIIRWSPFIQVFKKHRYPWIQLAGHQGNFQAGEAGSVLKKLDSREHQSFQRLMHDRLQPYVPEFRGVVEKNGERYVQLQDLLCEFNSPCVMDIKMGVRTYLEEELTKARKKPTLRKDMYQKMVDVDSNAPTAEEHQQRAVTKPRYMQWRDQMSSSVNLGFRIEGIKKSDGASSKDFKKTKSRDSVADILKTFIGDDETVLAKYLHRLREICSTQESSEFFQSHEVIGSSLLFVHDGQGEVNVWMIDFGKTEPLPKGVSINHRSTWIEGNHEDGYLFGLDNIISMLEELQASSMA